MVARKPLVLNDEGVQEELQSSDTLAIGDYAIVAVIDGGGSAISTGIKLDIGPLPVGGTIKSATIVADQVGSIVVDVWKDSYANFPPTDVPDSITASAPITLSSAQKSQDSTLTGWTKTLNVGDILRFNVDSVATVTRVTVVLTVGRE